MPCTDISLLAVHIDERQHNPKQILHAAVLADKFQKLHKALIQRLVKSRLHQGKLLVKRKCLMLQQHLAKHRDSTDILNQAHGLSVNPAVRTSLIRISQQSAGISRGNNSCIHNPPYD